MQSFGEIHTVVSAALSAVDVTADVERGGSGSAWRSGNSAWHPPDSAFWGQGGGWSTLHPWPQHRRRASKGMGMRMGMGTGIEPGVWAYWPGQGKPTRPAHLLISPGGGGMGAFAILRNTVGSSTGPSLHGNGSKFCMLTGDWCCIL